MCKVKRSVVVGLAPLIFIHDVNRLTLLNGSGLRGLGIGGFDRPLHPGQGCVLDFRIPAVLCCSLIQFCSFFGLQVVQGNIIIILKAMDVARCILIAGDPARCIRRDASRNSISRSRGEISTNAQFAHTGGFVLFTMEIGDLGACHIRRAFNGIFLHIDDVLGLLAGVGCICGLSFRNLCPSGAVGQGVGFAANLCRKGVALVQLLLRKFQVGDFCLQLAGGSRVLNAQLVHCLGQGAPDGIFLGFFRSDLLTGGSRVALLRGRQGHFISEAPAEKFVLRYVQLDGLVVRGGVVDLTVRTQFVVLVAIFFQSVNDLCVAQLRFSGLGSLLNNVLLAVLGEMDSVIHHCTLIEHLFQILGLNGLNHCIVVALDLDTGVCHLVSERFTAILLCLFPGDGQLGGGLGGDLVVPNGDVGGAGLGVALCVQNGLGPGEGIGAVGVHRGLFGIHQLGDVFGGHLGGLGIFLAEHQSLLVAIVRVGHFLYLVVVDRLIALFNIPADVRLLAQLFL